MRPKRPAGGIATVRPVRRRAAALLVAVAAAGGALAIGWPGAASAASGAITVGWWSQATVIPGAPTGVPAGGMEIENYPQGPFAIGAVRFDAPAGSAPVLTLTLNGPGALTQPPQACLLTSPFTAVQGGAWSGRPSYTCQGAVTGVLAASGTSVSFDLSPLIRSGQVAAAILATGPVDRAVIDPPAVQESAPSSPAQPTPVSASPVSPTAAPATGPAPAPTVAAGPGAALPTLSAAPLQATPAQSPLLAAPSSPPSSSAAAVVAASRPPGSSWRRSLGGIAGTSLLLALIVYWSDGFGALPLRSMSAARRVGSERSAGRVA